MNPDKLTPGQRSASTSNRKLRGPPRVPADGPTSSARPWPAAACRSPATSPTSANSSSADGERHRTSFEPLNHGLPCSHSSVHKGRLAVLDWTDVNTDLIIPAFGALKPAVERTGFGPLLFADKRYAPGGAPEIDEPERHGPENPDFPLNDPAIRGATILVVGRNFGCGSSREHAVWAVMQAGYRAIIAPGKGEGFADIFRI